MLKNLFLFFLAILLFTVSNGQDIIIKGKVTDAETGEGMPFVTVVVKNTGRGTTTDFEGYYTLKTVNTADSLISFYMGYKRKAKAIGKEPQQTINIQLEPEINMLSEVVIVPGENPAFRIMRKVMENKKANDKKSLTSYEYESYNKIELDIDNLTEKFRKKKVMNKITAIYDSLKIIAGEDGSPVLPVFISESISKYYFKDNPQKTKEEIKAVKITGVGLDDGSLISQLIGSSFQQYNFYNNWLNLLEKDFISPIADSWQTFYNYELLDSSYMGGHWTYKIDVKPKQPQDLAFTGTIWIADTSFALKQIDVTVDKRANLNYIEKIKIQQELTPTEAGPWLPLKTRILIDIEEIGDTSPGMLAKFYTSNTDFVVNQTKGDKFFEELIVVDEEAQMKDDQFWEEKRHDPLSETEKAVYATIDSVRNIPLVKTYVEIVNIAVNGYKRIGKLDIGPYLMVYANNNIEGHRFRMGARTNINFSKKWVLKGYGAYGTGDQEFKYGVGVDYILSRKRWTTASIERFSDIDQVGVSSEYLVNNNLFLAFTRFGTLRGPYYTDQNIVKFQTELRKDLTQKISFRTKSFDPAFPFAYFNNPESGDSSLSTRFNTSEVILETRFTKDEYFIQNENERISLGTKAWPIFTVRYTAGLKGVLDGDFNYHKVSLQVSQTIRAGALGRSYYDFVGAKVFSRVPYPLLEVHMGNESPFYTTAAFNLMNYFEFISDQFVALRYRHYFEGFFFNRIPLLKKLKWRSLVSANILYGDLSQKNINLISPQDPTGTFGPQFQSLKDKPYVEVGYGIENIFKIFRVDAFHRLTYLDKPNVNRFGVKVSVQFAL